MSCWCPGYFRCFLQTFFLECAAPWNKFCFAISCRQKCQNILVIETFNCSSLRPNSFEAKIIAPWNIFAFSWSGIGAFFPWDCAEPSEVCKSPTPNQSQQDYVPIPESDQKTCCVWGRKLKVLKRHGPLFYSFIDFSPFTRIYRVFKKYYYLVQCPENFTFWDYKLFNKNVIFHIDYKAKHFFKEIWLDQPRSVPKSGCIL